MFDHRKLNILLDVTRLSIRMFRTAPTGIDRVEYAYAKELITSARAVGVFTTPFFSGAIPKSRALDLLERVERAWGLGLAPSADPVFKEIEGWLQSPLDTGSLRAKRFMRKAQVRAFLSEAGFFPARDVLRGSIRLDRWIGRRDGEFVYYHCSHAQLDKSRRFDWLLSKGVPSVFFIHDAIPIEYPEFCSPGAYDRHLKRLLTVAKFTSLIIVNSEESKRAVQMALQGSAVRQIQIEVVPLGIDQAFLAKRSKIALRSERPYFLVVGTIEPRKNLLFLLNVWRRLVERWGERAPRLILAGRRGWENENIIDILERSKTLAPFVAEVCDLTDAGLATLMANALAVLAPSLVEGFGLPVAEALAVGTPVIASDIPAHVEVAGDCAHYADPIDGPAWISAIEAFLDPKSDIVAKSRAKIEGYRYMSWAQHIERTTELLTDVLNSRMD